jgi:uncharacterized protein with PQ loop repeat
MDEQVKTKSKRVSLDNVICIVAVLGPLTGVPQIIDIWVIRKTGEGVYVTSWVLFLIFSLLWLWYGTVRKDKALLLSNALWILVEIMVILGALLLR